MEQRLVDIEIRMTYLEKYVSDLNKVIIEQNQKIETLQSDLKKIKDEIIQDNFIREQEKPPHY